MEYDLPDPMTYNLRLLATVLQSVGPMSEVPPPPANLPAIHPRRKDILQAIFRSKKCGNSFYGGDSTTRSRYMFVWQNPRLTRNQWVLKFADVYVTSFGIRNPSGTFATEQEAIDFLIESFMPFDISGTDLLRPLANSNDFGSS